MVSAKDAAASSPLQRILSPAIGVIVCLAIIAAIPSQWEAQVADRTGGKYGWLAGLVEPLGPTGFAVVIGVVGVVCLALLIRAVLQLRKG